MTDHDEGQHDAASVVGQMAGLGEQKEPVPPERLIKAFCESVEPGLVADSGVKQEAGRTTARGFCGYNGRDVSDPLLSGFDDGYAFMGFLEEHGWRALVAKGDWPYVVYLGYRHRPPWAIAEYCEADLTVWTFENGEAAQAFYKTLRDCP